MKLLLVEDSEAIRKCLLRLLDGVPGIGSIQVAATLAQALHSARRVPPAMAILDLHLPDGNATQIMDTLKMLAPGVKIAVLTNDASEFNRIHCRQAGATWFFDKSTECEALLQLVQAQAASMQPVGGGGLSATRFATLGPLPDELP